MAYYATLILIIGIAAFFIFTWVVNLFKKKGVHQDVEVLGDDQYKIITRVWRRGDLIKKFEKVTRGKDAEKVANEQREKGKNHYKIIKRFSR